MRELEVDRLRTLYRLLTELSQASDIQQVYQAAVSSLLRATAAERAAILLYDDDGVMRFKASHGLSAEYQEAVTGHSPWRRGEMGVRPVVVGDVGKAAALDGFRRVFRREGIASLAFIPLALDAGVFGKFMLYYSEPHECAGDELEVAQTIAAHVALATQRKREEQARKETEGRLQAIIDNSLALIFMKDRAGRYLLLNRRAEEVFGVKGADLMGKTDRDIFPAEVADRFQAHDRAVIERGEAITMEETAPNPDGDHTYIASKFPVKGPDGEICGVCGIATDITERKELEGASRLLAAIVESSDDAILSKDLNGIITSWNKGAERIFQYQAHEIVGKPVSALAPEGHKDEMPRILARLRAGERVEHFETRRRRKDGEIIDVSLTVSPMRDATGRIIGASKVARDITEQKRHEKERLHLLAREREARRTAELLNLIGPRLAAQLDLNKLVQEVTDIATTVVGAQFGAFFHNVVNEDGESYTLYTISGVPREAFSNFPMPRNTELFGPTFRGEGMIRCDDVTKDPRYGKNEPYYGMPTGHLPVRSYLAAPVRARSGEVLGGLFFGHAEVGKFSELHETILTGIAAQAGIALDNARLFEQIQTAQTELQRFNEELCRMNQDLEGFAYSASHDLREPLRNISISAQLLQRSLGASLQRNDAATLDHIISSAKRMTELVQDLLQYTGATKYEPAPAEPVDAGRVFREVLENLRLPIEESGAEVTAGELPRVAVQGSRLAQVLQNLIGNAIKYRGEEVPRIHVSASESDGWCVFRVEDNGIGIQPQYWKQIFELFKRLHGADRYPGSGIGLAVCQRVVQQYGGRIWLERSEPGRGSVFAFSVPSRR